MQKDLFRKLSKPYQYLIGILAVVLVAAICYSLSNFIGYRVVALILLFTVTVVAMFFDIFPVLLVAFLSAVIWDFFFIPPKFTLWVNTAEDILMLLMYFTIAMLSGVLSYKNRQWEKIARKKEEKQNTLMLYNTVLNSLSHELRTPISTIICATDNLKTGKGILSESDKEELVIEISKASLKLNGQVQNLLNMSRLESGVIKPVKDWCDINELISDVLSQLKEYSSSHNIKIRVEEDLPLFKIDFGLIQQALYNLLYNAIIYTPPNSAIVVSAVLRNSELVLCIDDSGKGFPANEKDNVFEKFYRLKNSKTGGTGLGLSIVKGFIEAHDGIIILENKNEGGAKFTISIPAETSRPSNLKNE